MKNKIFLWLIFLVVGGMVAAENVVQKMAQATLAGGCFWCMEHPFEKLDGVLDVISGYTGGKGENPTYGDYAQKGHIEAVQITYDPKKISYDTLLDVFWHQIDPTDDQGQFVDRGRQYRTAIFYHNDEQKKIAEILSAVDDAIQKTEAVIEKTNELKRCAVHVLFLATLL